MGSQITAFSKIHCLELTYNAMPCTSLLETTGSFLCVKDDSLSVVNVGCKNDQRFLSNPKIVELPQALSNLPIKFLYHIAIGPML